MRVYDGLLRDTITLRYKNLIKVQGPPVSKDLTAQPLGLDMNSYQHISPREGVGGEYYIHHLGYVHWGLLLAITRAYHTSALYISMAGLPNLGMLLSPKCVVYARFFLIRGYVLAR